MLFRSGEAWYYIDLNEMYSSMGMDINFSELMESIKGNSFDFESYLKDTFQTIPLTSVNDYDAFQQSVAAFINLFGDNAFQQQADGYVSQFNFSENGTDMNFTLKLLGSNEAITGYNMDISVGMSGTNYITATASQNNTDSTVVFNLNIPDMLTMIFNCGMTMESTDQTALSEPSGTIINIMDMMPNME